MADDTKADDAKETGAANGDGDAADTATGFTLPKELANDPDVLAALKTATLAELGQKKAVADAATSKAGVPEAASLGEIKAPSDRTVTVGEGAGSAIAGLAAARALDMIGLAIGTRVASALTGIELLPARPRLPAIIEYYADPDNAQEIARAEQRQHAAQAKRGKAVIVYVVDSPSLAVAALSLLEVRKRLDAYGVAFIGNTPRFNFEPAVAERLGASLVGKDAEMSASLAAELGANAAASLAAPALMLGVNAAGALAKFGVELVGALQSRYAMHARSVTLDRTALVSAVVDRLLDVPVTVRWPRFQWIDNSPVLDALREATIARDRFAMAHRARTQPVPRTPDPSSDPSDGAEKPGKPADLLGAGGSEEDKELSSFAAKKPDKPKKPGPAVPAVPSEDPLSGTASDLISGFDSYVASILKPDADGVSAIAEAALIEAAMPAGGDKTKSYLLFVGITAQGADGMTGQGLLHGSSASFVGFAQAYFVLTRPDGSIISSGTSTKNQSIRVGLGEGKLYFTDDR